jgi:hypothetical protein
MSSFLPTHRLFGGLLISMASVAVLWAYFGRLDIVAISSGKLVPTKYVQISQPVEQMKARIPRPSGRGQAPFC